MPGKMPGGTLPENISHDKARVHGHSLQVASFRPAQRLCFLSQARADAVSDSVDSFDVWACFWELWVHRVRPGPPGRFAKVALLTEDSAAFRSGCLTLDLQAAFCSVKNLPFREYPLTYVFFCSFPFFVFVVGIGVLNRNETKVEDT